MVEAAQPERRFQFRNLPIKHKLTVIVVATVSVAVLLSLIGIVAADSILFRGYLSRDLTALASIVADNSTAALSFDDPSAAARTLSALRARPHVVAACIYRPDGTTFATYFGSGYSQRCPETNRNAVWFTRTASTVSRSILLQGRTIGTLVLQYDLGEMFARARIYGATVLGVMLASGVVAFLLSSRLRELIAQPLAQLALAATAVSETRDYGIRAQKESSDELGVLVDAFNEMLKGIQSRDLEIRQALSDRERALAEVGRAEGFLRTTLANIGDAVLRVDSQGRIVYANPVAQSLLKAPESKLIDRHAREVLHLIDEATREQVEDPISRVLRDGAAAGNGSRTVLVAGNGSEVPIDEDATPIRNERGLVEGAVLVFRDVAERRRAEEISRLLAAIVESSDDAIISAGLNGLVTSWNRGAERMLGYSADEMIGKPLSIISAADRPDDIPAILKRIGRGEAIDHYETIRRTKTGRLIHVSLTISPLRDASGRIIGASKIARDITSQVEAAQYLARINADLRQSNLRLAQSNEDLERFAFIASHDLQEPLRIITTYAQLLARTNESRLQADGVRFLHNIADGARRMRQLLADLLAFTEINARSDAPVEIVDLNDVLETVKSNLQASIDETAATVVSEKLPALEGHAGHFIPLFQNLIGNAIKYRGERPPQVQISVRERQAEFEFSVADNGIGIDPEYHQKIFVAFKRLHGKRIPGTGIGLAICQRVVERYGGRIWVQSESGQGATFFFTVPKHPGLSAGSVT